MVTRLPTIGMLELNNVKIIWRDEAANSKRELHLNRVSVSAKSPGSPIEVALEGSLNGERMLISGALSPYADLLDHEPLSLKLKAELADNNLELEGSITEPQAVRGLSIVFKGSGKDLSSLSGLTGLELPAGILGTSQVDLPTSIPGSLSLASMVGRAPMIWPEIFT